LRGRPYEIVAVAGGWSFRTKLGFGEAIRAALGGPQKSELSPANALVLMAIAYFQPITRGELSQLLGREVSRDAIAALREQELIVAGPRSPTPGVCKELGVTRQTLYRLVGPNRELRRDGAKLLKSKAQNVS
jgi:segregation and condensation protein B